MHSHILSMSDPQSLYSRVGSTGFLQDFKLRALCSAHSRYPVMTVSDDWSVSESTQAASKSVGVSNADKEAPEAPVGR